MDWFSLLEKAFWGGSAAVGFAVLFNVPLRALFTIFLLGAIGCLLKFSLISLEVHVVVAAFIGATVIGLLSVPAAHTKHAPPLVFSIPAVIPLVPGIFAYRTMLVVMKLSAPITDNYTQILSETLNNGTKAAFIVLALAVGVGIPNLITRKESAKQIRVSHISK